MILVTLTTDFGFRDPYVGVMKGVILSIAPECTLVDLTHGITPHSVLEANFALRGSWKYFPEGTIHVVVVDPGVGGPRRILYLETGGQRFLAPDNGVLSGLLEQAERLHAVENTRLFRDSVSHTFHGRDIFAPVAARIARGLDPSELGPPVEDPVTVSWCEPTLQGDEIEGCIIYVDVFGNLVSNITREQVRALGVEHPRVFLCGREIGTPRPSYTFAGKGEPVAVFGSFGHLEVAVNEGNAAQVFGAGTGDEITVTG